MVSLLAPGRFQHRRLLLRLDLLQPLLLLEQRPLLHALLRLLLGLLARFFLLLVALHPLLREGLVADEAAVHSLLGHLPWPPRLLDAIAMGLRDLVVVRVILGLGHGCHRPRRAAGTRGACWSVGTLE